MSWKLEDSETDIQGAWEQGQAWAQGRAPVTSCVDTAPFLWKSDRFGAVGNELPESVFSVPGEPSDRCWQLMHRCKNHYRVLPTLACNPYHCSQSLSLTFPDAGFSCPHPPTPCHRAGVARCYLFRGWVITLCLSFFVWKTGIRQYLPLRIAVRVQCVRC